MTISPPHVYSLQTMPAPVFHSTLQTGCGFLGRLFRLAANAAEWLLTWLVRLSPLLLLAW